MSEDRMRAWETLFRHALTVLDNAIEGGMPDDWSFGGGTVLMLKHRHRFSKDVDIFVPDSQCLGFLSPRLNDDAGEDPRGYDEQTNSLKIYYSEGEVDFVVATPLTPMPFERQTVLGRAVNVETPLEIVAKKLQFRAAEFKARDLFDLALVLERELSSIPFLRQLIQAKQEALLARFQTRESSLREDFEAIDVLDCRPTFDACRKLVEEVGGILLR
jgi:hypothetical protein